MGWMMMNVLAVVLAQDECSFTACKLRGFENLPQCFSLDEAVSLETISTCLDGINLETNRTEVLETLSKVIPLYAHLNHAKNPSILQDDPVDLDYELSLMSDQYDNDYEFHRAVHNLFRRLNDANTKYYLPKCFSHLVVALPFHLGSFIDEKTGNQKVFIKSIRKDVNMMEKFNDVQKIKGMAGSVVGTMDYTAAFKYVRDWSIENVGLFKDAGARFNAATNELFSTRRMDSFDRPESEAIDISVQGSPGVHQVKWFGYSTVSYANNDEFLAACMEKQEIEVDTSVFSQLNIGKHFNIKKEYSGDQIQYYQIDKVAVISLESFAPQSENTFLLDLSSILNMIETNKMEKLIIDISNNKGGDSCLTKTVLNRLYTNLFGMRSVDVEARMDLADSDIGREMAIAGAVLPNTSNSIWSPSAWKNSNGEIFTDANWFLNQVNITRGSMSAFYTSPIYEHDCIQNSEESGGERTDGSTFSSDNVILLSNGICIGSCALFARHFQAFKMVKTVSTGGFNGKSPQMAHAADAIYEMDILLKEMKSLNVTSSVKPFDTSTRFTFAIAEQYGWSDNIEPLEYLVEPADFHLMFTKENSIDQAQVWVDSLKYFDICASWQTKPCSLINGQGVRKCTMGKYEDACTFVSCEAEYSYQNATNGCIYVSDNPLSQGYITLFVALLILFLIIAVLGWICWRPRTYVPRKSRMDEKAPVMNEVKYNLLEQHE